MALGTTTLALGVKVKQLRIERGFTQQRLANEAGVGHSLITALESGRKRYISYQQVNALAAALQVEEDELWETIPGGRNRLEARYIPLLAA